jgi:O-antigen/teichoic acid export membrane protein
VFILLVGETAGLWFLYNKLVIPPERFTAAFVVYQISLLNAVVTLTQVPYNASIIAHEKMNVYAWVSIAEAGFKMIIAYLLFIFQIDKLILYAGLLFISSALIRGYYRYYCNRHFVECKFRFYFDKELYRRLASYSGWDLFGNLAWVCQGQGINIVLNLFHGPAVNAARAITVQIQSVVQTFVGNFLTASRPQLIKLYAEKK